MARLARISLLLLVLLAGPVIRVRAQDVPASPLYYGPLAFPIPDIEDAALCGDMKAKVAGDFYRSKSGDNTFGLYLELDVPLFTSRAHFKVWYPMVEWYKAGGATKHMFGDVNLSVYFSPLIESKHWLNFGLRAAIKTASGGAADLRYYDAPGYFFDGTFSKTINFRNKEVKGLRIALNAGFLCWQTGPREQNDAVMYGAQLKLLAEHFTFGVTYSGYVGWQKNGDVPMSLKIDLALHFGRWEPFLRYQEGFKDYPYRQVRVGLAYNLPLFK
ncbi:MAG: hypothetical protein HUJ89_05040 [Bacteroidales bacterium]|nr:hypothetical protein [Bacteroidales bacterium]